ncbi:MULTISPECIES: polysaccharide biosynthesis protein [unclassified Paenibacillus]|uniref:polysaccharide biosynthesis protein n=1 Tax=unclassified Paenibacillus TaxID=185978 RepID=UPI00095435C4|nr:MULTISPECIES: polysaccharide biosynthesis protein [unclassified Paenibacillus]ASS69352.2 polysaccharide biosynthesis protein [Paenibacillus sp. RUD330]SIR66607.1 Membrane protein involved in the export of O-antigen and teichoic acid [Paenibacillus sp. RU4X]SIR74501.1 Membrane protein involved in the export of O-antigen and teichoic acid [Paenibacillus sp. RU4T]
MPRQKWEKGALGGAMLLAGAALLSKLIGTLQKIPLQNIAGDRVFGIYNAVYPFYQLMLVLATAGLPVAVAIRTASLLEEGDKQGARRAGAAGVLLLSVLGAAGFAILWTGASAFADLIGDSSAEASIRAVAAALWVVPALAALRGYTQGTGDMRPTAWSQLIEQLVRVAAMLLLLHWGWSAGWDDCSLAAGAMSGSFFGGFAGLLFMIRMAAGRRSRGNLARAAGSGDQEELAKDAEWRLPLVRRLAAMGNEIRRLAVLALPVALGAIVAPVLGAVDAFTVPRLLAGAGSSPAEAMSAFGLYSRGQPLVQLVSMVAGAAAGALVPGLVRQRRSRPEAAAAQARLAMRAAWLIGLASAAGLVLLAEPLNVMFYTDAQATGTLALVCGTALFAAVTAVSAPVLQGLGAVRAPVILLLLAALIKTALNAALVPPLGIAGAAWAGIAATGAAALLGALAAARSAAALGAPARGARRGYGAAAALAALAAAALAASRGLEPLLAAALPPRLLAAALTLAGVLAGGAAFAAALLRLGGVSAAELRQLPGGEALEARLRRLKLLPPA